jgi:hypothetical protein
MTYFAVTDTDRAASRATELGGAVGAPPFDTAFGQVAAQGDRTGPGGGRNSGVGPGVRCPLAGSSSYWTWG